MKLTPKKAIPTSKKIRLLAKLQSRARVRARARARARKKIGNKNVIGKVERFSVIQESV